MSVAIAYQAVNQVIFDKEPIIAPGNQNFNVEGKQSKADYGDTLTIV